MSCGTALAARCPSCTAENPPGAKFCIECGTTLTGAPAPPPAETAQEPLPEERRKATVLFADLSGYTAVAERMDPEAVKAMVEGALRRLGDEVARYGGSVDKYIGDNVMAVFGAPGRARGRPGARRPCRPRDAGRDGRDQRAGSRAT